MLSLQQHKKAGQACNEIDYGSIQGRGFDSRHLHHFLLDFFENIVYSKKNKKRREKTVDDIHEEVFK